jgi:hypothetical protein
MSLTEFIYSVLPQFFWEVEKRREPPVMPLERDSTQQDTDNGSKELPKGVVLGPDGKPYVRLDYFDRED